MQDREQVDPYIRAKEVFAILPAGAFSIQTLQRLGDSGEIRTVRLASGRRDRRYLRSDVLALRDRMLEHTEEAAS